MIVTIQGIPDRTSNIKKLLTQVDAKVHYDYKMKGAFYSFKDMLDIPFEGYRLHLQDDVIIPKGFSDYLPILEKEIAEKGIDVISLFAPKRKFVIEQYEKGIKYGDFPNFLWLQATVFSKRFVELMKERASLTKETKHDDVFVAETLKVNKIKAYVHLPSIVQHNIYMGSSMGNSNSENRMSPIYEPNYIKTQLS